MSAKIITLIFPEKAFRLLFLLLLVTCLVTSWSRTGLAHIEADMPDPIAEIEYQMMLEFEPDDSTTRYKLAMVYYRLNKEAEAEAELKKVLAVDAHHFHALEGMGMLRLRQEKYNEAVTVLEKAVQQKENESGTYYYLGQAKQGIQDHAGAKAAFSEGLAKCLTEKESERALSIDQFQEAIAKIDK